MMFNLAEISKGCAKGLLLSMNIFCILLSTFTFGFAVVDSRILKQYGEEQAVGTFAGDMVIITVSILLVAVALLGCVGIVKDNAKILYLYVGFLMILVILELLVGIFVAIQRCGLHLKVTDWLREDFYKNTTGEELTAHEKIWDVIQMDYECCGLNGPEDYAALHQSISLSCCPRAYRARSVSAQKQIYRACIENLDYYSDGCEDVILDGLRADADWLLGAAVMTFWFEAAGILLAVWIANHLRNCVQVYKKTVKY